MKKCVLIALTIILTGILSIVGMAKDLDWESFYTGTLLGEYSYTTINSESMNPTLKSGDSVVIELLTDDMSLDRGDIIVYQYPVDASKGKETSFIHRIIGMPGETVDIDSGKIYIDGSSEPLDEPYIDENWVVENDGFSFEVPDDCFLLLGDNRNNSNDSRYWGIMALRDGIADDPEEALKLSYVKRDQIHGKAVSKIAFEPIE